MRRGLGVLIAGLLAAAPAGAAVPEGTVHEEATIVSADGTRLHADVFRPAGVDSPTPVVIDAGPYWGAPGVPPGSIVEHPTTPYPDMVELIEHRYTLVTVDLRGYGGSEGCLDLGGPREREDMRAVVDWAAAQPWSTGRVGMTGFSYDGYAALAAVAAAPAALDAVILMSPIVNIYNTLYSHRVRVIDGISPLYGPGVTSFDLIGPSPAGPADLLLANAGSLEPECRAEMNAGLLNPDPKARFWRERDLGKLAAGSRVPVLFGYGVQDDAVTPAGIPSLLKAFRGPMQAWLGQFDHRAVVDGGTAIGRDGFRAQQLRFFDRHLRDVEPAIGDPRFVVQEGAGGWRAERRWPPRVQRMPFAVRSGSYADLPGNTADRRSSAVPGLGLRGEAPRQGAGSWTFSQPLPRALHLTGVPRLRAELDGPAGAHVVALLYDVAPDGTATLVSRTAAELPVGPLPLWAQDWRFDKGHRIGLLLSGADDSRWQPGLTGATVSVKGGTLKLPFATKPAGDALDGTTNDAIAARAPFSVPAETISGATLEQPLP